MENCTFRAVIVSYIILNFILTQNKCFESTLSDEQRSIYKNIKTERTFIFSLGVYTGLLVSYVVLRRSNTNYPTCTGFALSYVIASTFYMIVPKSKYMIEELRQDQMKDWLYIYNNMKIANALFFGLAVITLILKV